MAIEMGLYVEIICSGHRNGFILEDHMQRTDKWLACGDHFAKDINMGSYLKCQFLG